MIANHGLNGLYGLTYIFFNNEFYELHELATPSCRVRKGNPFNPFNPLFLERNHVRSDTSCFLCDDKSCFAQLKVISKPWKYISEAWKYILVPLKYISVPLKKFCAVGRGICGPAMGNLCPWGGVIVSVAAEGAKRVIVSPEKEKMRSKCWGSREKVLNLYRLMRVCVRRHEV